MDALKGFLDRARDDHRIGPMHISLYVVLLQISEQQPATAPGRAPAPTGFFAIYRDDVMARAKLLGRTTYYRRLRELSAWGYIVYHPQHYPGLPCRVKPNV